MAELIKVLSIDGGGIRGIIPAVVMTEIEDRTGKPISELFQLVAGTSTGGILALGLVKPKEEKLAASVKDKLKESSTSKSKPTEKTALVDKIDSEIKKGVPEFKAEDLVKLYEDEGRTIFPRSYFKQGWLGPKYPPQGIQKVLKKRFGDTRLKDALTDVLITSYDTERRGPFYFNSNNAKKKKADDFSMVEVARATSAAPTYFPPFKLETKGVGNYATLIDGGVFANNPALRGYIEAKRIYGEAADVFVLSLGTGDLNRRLSFEMVKAWGKTKWARPILDVVFDGVSIITDEMMSSLLPDSKYVRFQARLDKGNDELDDAGEANIRNLKLAAEDIYKKRPTKKAFDDLIKFLKPS